MSPKIKLEDLLFHCRQTLYLWHMKSSIKPDMHDIHLTHWSPHKTHTFASIEDGLQCYRQVARSWQSKEAEDNLYYFFHGRVIEYNCLLEHCGYSPHPIFKTGCAGSSSFTALMSPNEAKQLSEVADWPRLSTHTADWV